MIKKILYRLLLCLANFCYAQQLPSTWVNKNTNTKSIFIVSQNFLSIDGIKQTVQNQDAIGVFVPRSTIDSTKKCVGYIILDSIPSLKTLYAQKRDTGTYGYDDGQIAQIRYWSEKLKCQHIVNTSLVYALKGRTDTIKSAIASTPSIQYASDTFTIGSGFALPNVVKDLEVKFYSSGLPIDTNSGSIDLANSLPGNYEIEFKSTFCLTAKLKTIVINKRTETIDTSELKLDISRIITNILPATCDQDGSLFIRNNSITGIQPITYKIVNRTDNTHLTNSSGVFNELKEGIYTLYVSDSAGNTAMHPSVITVTKVGDCYNTVLKPDGKDGVQTLYIPEVGYAKILNRSGEVIKLLPIPAEWNCDDAQGKPVPMGDYYLFINEAQSKVITVLR